MVAMQPDWGRGAPPPRNNLDGPWDADVVNFFSPLEIYDFQVFQVKKEKQRSSAIISSAIKNDFNPCVSLP